MICFLLQFRFLFRCKQTIRPSVLVVDQHAVLFCARWNRYSELTLCSSHGPTSQACLYPKVVLTIENSQFAFKLCGYLRCMHFHQAAKRFNLNNVYIAFGGQIPNPKLRRSNRPFTPFSSFLNPSDSDRIPACHPWSIGDPDAPLHGNFAGD